MGFDILVLTFLMSHHFKRNIGQHFIGIHIGRRTGTALVQIDQEPFMVFSVNDGLAGFFDGIQLFFREPAHIVVGPGSCHFYHRISPDIIRIKFCRHSADLEILQGPHGLNPIIGFGRDLFFTQQVLFGPRLLGHTA